MPEAWFKPKKILHSEYDENDKMKLTHKVSRKNKSINTVLDLSLPQ